MKQVPQLDNQGVFIGMTTADPSPLEDGVYLLPAGAIDADAPQIPQGKAAIWQDGWHYVDDLRGQTAHDIKTGDVVVIDTIGALADNLTLMPRPTNYHIWQNGTWVISQEQQQKYQAEQLSNAKATKTAQINQAAQAHINQTAGLTDIPDFEIQTWTIQALEAKAWHADNTTPTPTLDTIAAARGVDVNVLRQKAYKKAIKFEKLSAYVAGVRQRLTDLTEQAKSIDELNQIVIEFALSENTKQ